MNNVLMCFCGIIFLASSCHDAEVPMKSQIDSVYPVWDSTGTNFGLINSKGDIVLPMKYFCISFPEKGKVAAQSHNCDWFLFDLNGNLLDSVIAENSSDYSGLSYECRCLWSFIGVFRRSDSAIGCPLINNEFFNSDKIYDTYYYFDGCSLSVSVIKTGVYRITVKRSDGGIDKWIVNDHSMTNNRMFDSKKVLNVKGIAYSREDTLGYYDLKSKSRIEIKWDDTLASDFGADRIRRVKCVDRGGWNGDYLFVPYALDGGSFFQWRCAIFDSQLLRLDKGDIEFVCYFDPNSKIMLSKRNGKLRYESLDGNVIWESPTEELKNPYFSDYYLYSYRCNWGH